jgi:hypothetical protein
LGIYLVPSALKKFHEVGIVTLQMRKPREFTSLAQDYTESKDLRQEQNQGGPDFRAMVHRNS